MPERLAQKVLLIGWDAADWKVITPLLDAGQMPALERLIDRGVMGNLATLDPPLSPMLWTSIATGMTADQHGILNFLQPDASGERVRPVLGTSRKVKALWNILNQNGLRSNVVGWWPSHPAEPVRGAMVSNFYHRVLGAVHAPRPLPPGTVHPPELADVLGALRLHPQELTAAHLLPFVPRAADPIPEDRRHLPLLARTIAEAANIQAAATYLLDHTEWDFMAVYFDAIDHFGHGFMKYHPPRRPGLPEPLYDRYQGVVAGGYRLHDMMLEQLLTAVDDDTTVLLISDHGFHSDHLRPLELPDEPAAPALEHRPFGVVVMAGPGIRRDERVYGATLLDIAPTVLALFGLPLGRDMVGTPMAGAFEAPLTPAYVDSWEEIDGDDGRHSDDARRDPWAEQEAMRQLVELGYVEPGPSGQRVETVVRESHFYLARVHLSQGRPEVALPLLRAAFEAEPDAERYGLRLVEALRCVGHLDEAHAVLDRVLVERTARLRRKAEHLDRVLAQAEPPAEAPEPEAPPPSPERLQHLRRLRARLGRQLERTPPGYHYHRGLLLLEADRAEEAVQAFEATSARLDRFPMLRLRLGEAYLRLQRWADAEEAFRGALELNPEEPLAHHGLAVAHLRQGRPAPAAAAALHAVGLRYFLPAAHYHLGEALLGVGEFARAAQAFEVAVHQQPGIRRAHAYLADLYRSHLDAPRKAAHHLRLADEQVA